MPPPWENEVMPESLRLMCHHLVGLTWYQGETHEDGEYNSLPQWQCASAFVVDVANVAWMVTAGHVFSTVEEKKTNPRFKTSNHRVCDIWSPLAQNTMPVPYDFFDPSVRRIQIHREDRGVDLAFLPITPYLGQFLTKTIVPFRREDWFDSDSREYDTYYIIGTPGCLAHDEVVKTSNGGTITVHNRPFLVGVNRIADDGRQVEKRNNPQFVARIHEAFPIESIIGMSGGPIVAFTHDENGNYRYWPVAVQSRWDRKKRIVIGTLLAPCLVEFERLLMRKIEEPNSLDASVE